MKNNFLEFPQLCVTALANLQQASLKDGTSRCIFSKDKEIIPFIEQHWDGMTTIARRLTQSWHTTVQKALVKDIHVLFIYEESASDGQMYGLANQDLTQIKPNYEAMIRGGTIKITEMGIQHGKNVFFVVLIKPPKVISYGVIFHLFLK